MLGLLHHRSIPQLRFSAKLRYLECLSLEAQECSQASIHVALATNQPLILSTKRIYPKNILFSIILFHLSDFKSVRKMNTSIIVDLADPQRAALYKGMETREQNEYERLRVQQELHKSAMHGLLIRVPISRTDPVRILDPFTNHLFCFLFKLN